MCGIVGILGGSDHSTSIDLFTDSLAHRGPDGRGVYSDEHISLGHRRLAILDLTERGGCPMRYRAPDGRELLITYNGEVYNFLELRKELEARGHSFNSDSDTEVVCASFAEWGAECLTKFNGMWAFGIWDKSTKNLFLARDRYGIKPLYYSLQGNRFAFASELKAFCSLKGFQRRLDKEVANLALSQSQVLEGSIEKTLMQGVYRLLPGHCMDLSIGKPFQKRKWWNPEDFPVDVPNRYEDQVEKWRELFFDAVRLRLRSDVPVASSLSGGIDSSSVVAALAKVAKLAGPRAASNAIRAFIASFPETPMLNEENFAREVVDFCEIESTIEVFAKNEGLNRIAESVWALEDVYPGIGVAPIVLYARMREHSTKVSLDGHGGDELLGGYGWYLDLPVSQINQRLKTEFYQTLLPSILKNFDRASMWNGIEVRMPLMDWRLVNFSQALPPESKIGAGFTKRIMRDAMKGYLPEMVRLRKNKIGFNAPMVDWANCGYGGLVEKMVETKSWDSIFEHRSNSIKEGLLRYKNRKYEDSDWNHILGMWANFNLVIWNFLFIENGNLSDLN